MTQAKNRLRSAVAGLAVTAAVAAAVGFTGAGTALAATATIDLSYRCPFPLIGTQDVAVEIVAEQLPDSAVAGEETPAVQVTATATVPASATAGLSLVGARTIGGTATATTAVDNAGTPQSVVADLVVPSTPVPSSGAFDVVATGGTPAVTFAVAGPTTIDVGNFSTTLTPRRADGSLTGLGTFTSNCTLRPGQDTRLYEFTVQPAAEN
ncbi:DUF6801 domain-containing protein [Umezawaea beigongshangensis]|uniref:DUF6801 domain-containing protein n=1 Tax=Umezawaea beigongshangensis TaxID=2780383 RepID=UPI0018F1D0A2|nr:DUF6801 domain-containing protein [Umezawaea beigongshangensis]